MEEDLDSGPADCLPQVHPPEVQSPLLANIQGSSRREYGAMDTRTPPANASLAGGAEAPLPEQRPPSYSDASGSGAWVRSIRNGRHTQTQANEIPHSEGEVFVDLKKLTFATMCMLSPSATVSQCERNCSK